MPTGYTSILREREDISFKDFTLRCARAFGALVTMRDESLDAEIPTEFEPSDYHKKEFKKACVEYYKALKMSITYAKRKARLVYVEQVESYAKSRQEDQKTAVAYGKMLANTAKWQAPTEEHNGLRNFMIDQLEESIKFDCDYPNEMPVQMSGYEYNSQLIEKARWSMEYHKKEYSAEIRRCKKRTNWLNDLRKSLVS
jgi:hypothetical protein